MTRKKVAVQGATTIARLQAAPTETAPACQDDPKTFDRLYADITSDLGGDLTAVEKALVEGFVGAAVMLQSLNTRIALGQVIDPAEYASVCSSMVRIASKIGLSRRSRVVNGLIEAEVAPGAASPLRDRVTDLEEESAA